MGLLDWLKGSGKRSAPSKERAPSGPIVFGGFDGEMAFPTGIKERAVVLIDKNSAETNHRMLGKHFLAEQWNEAFPYAIAETFQTGSPVGMKYVGACFLKHVESAAATGNLSAQHKDYIASAVRCLTLAIEHGETDWDIYQFRGAANLIVAQLNRDRQALDRAEQDFRKSMSIEASDMIRRNLASVQDVRQRLFG